MITIVLASLLLVAGVQGQDTTPNPEMEQFMQRIHTIVEQLFQSADTNGNGHFDTQDLASLFSEYDDDGNGQVTPSQFINRFSTNSAMLRPIAAGLFLDLDMDKNQVLESGDVQLYFDKIDTNDDGRVTHDEFDDYFSQLFQVLFIIAIRNEASTPAP